MPEDAILEHFCFECIDDSLFGADGCWLHGSDWRDIVAWDGRLESWGLGRDELVASGLLV